MDLGHYNIFGQKEAALETAQNNRRLINIRWWFFLLVFGVAVASTYVTTQDSVRLQEYIAILVLGFAFNGLCYAAVRFNPTNLRSQQLITVMQLILDLVLIGIVTYVQGGFEARTTVLFMFPILASALLFRGNVVILTAAMSGATYVAAVLLHYYITTPLVSTEMLLLPLLFYPAVFLLLARVALYLEHWKTSQVRERAYNSFLSLVGHQLKHPASATMTIIDALSHDRKLALSDDALHYIELLKAENENQIRLIDNLLESAPQPRTVYHEDVDVSALMEKAALRIATSHERTDDLVKRKDSRDSVIVSANSARLALAFGNLFDNAFRYSKPGEKVSYSVTVKRHQAVVLINDAGIGMKHDGVMQKGRRLTIDGIRGMESSGHLGGLGLGLSASSRIIEAYGGQLDIHSSEQIGTTVTISLPAKEKHE